MLLKNKIAFCIGILCCISCDSAGVFDQYKTLSSKSWKHGQQLEFTFNIQDTIAKRNLFINLRNNNDYAFSNLFLITTMKFPHGQVIVDTLEYDMADHTGKFLGNGFTEIKENKLFYKEQITFPKQGIYHIAIEQAMRKSSAIEALPELKGITEVGFRIEKTN